MVSIIIAVLGVRFGSPEFYLLHSILSYALKVYWFLIIATGIGLYFFFSSRFQRQTSNPQRVRAGLQSLASVSLILVLSFMAYGAIIWLGPKLHPELYRVKGGHPIAAADRAHGARPLS